MHISAKILLEHGGIQKEYEKNEYIFHEGDGARYFYQIIKGKVKLFTTNTEGRIFVQGVFMDGESFGEPPMIIKEKYPVSAMAIESSIIIKISDSLFEKLMSEDHSINSILLNTLATRLYNKSLVTKHLINQKTEHRILAFLQDYKRKNGQSDKRMLIPFTRQEIADFTGLRVETIIRSLAELKEKNIVEIVERKLFY
jgi:CRP-like cAMP-binding protein